MTRIFQYSTDSDSDFSGRTVGEFLRSKGYTSRIISSLKRMETGIQVNSKKAFTNYLLQENDLLSITLEETLTTEKILPTELPFHIIYEDDDILVADKDDNTPVHPSIGNYDNTLANAAAWYFTQKGLTIPFRCINRLDRDTTGLLILAKHRLSGAILSEDMKKRRIQRTYLALVSGNFTETEGLVDAPLLRDPNSLMKRCVNPQGERALTHYKLLENLHNAALLQLHLETGRTHQIRVHMAHIGHPLPGDFLYNPEDHRCPRQMLHSSHLSFRHPITGEVMTFDAAMPADMQEAVYRLKKL